MKEGERQTLTDVTGEAVEAECCDYDNGSTGGWVFRLRDSALQLERFVTIHVTSEAKALADAKGLTGQIDGIIWNYLRFELASGRIRVCTEWNPTDRPRFIVRTGDLDRCRVL